MICKPAGCLKLVVATLDWQFEVMKNVADVLHQTG